MARIKGLKKDEVDEASARAFDQHIEQWGETLEPYEIYSRRPSILQSVLGMWGGLKESGLLEGSLTTLVNRRVAALNGCVF